MNTLPLLNLCTKIASLVGVVGILATVGSLAMFTMSYDSSAALDTLIASLSLVAAVTWAAITIIAIIARWHIFTTMSEISRMASSVAPHRAAS